MSLVIPELVVVRRRNNKIEVLCFTGYRRDNWIALNKQDWAELNLVILCKWNGARIFSSMGGAEKACKMMGGHEVVTKASLISSVTPPLVISKLSR